MFTKPVVTYSIDVTSCSAEQYWGYICMVHRCKGAGRKREKKLVATQRARTQKDAIRAAVAEVKERRHSKNWGG